MTINSYESIVISSNNEIIIYFSNLHTFLKLGLKP